MSALPRPIARYLARNRQRIGAVLMALAIGATGITVRVALSHPSVSLDEDLPTREVVTAAHDLAAGTVLTAKDVKVRSVPSLGLNTLSKPDEVIGKRVVLPVAAGETITSTRLQGHDLLSRLEGGSGRVAVPIRIADAGAAALVKPGDRIDVLMAPATGTARANAPQGRDSSAEDSGDVPAPGTIVSGGIVLDVPSADPASPTDGGLLLVAVAPREALAVGFAESFSRLSLVLRP